MRSEMKSGAAAAVAGLALAAASQADLPDCTINFEGACPNAATVCGADFSGGGGCIFAGLPNCYSSGLRSYEVAPVAPVTVTFTDSVRRLEVFFAGEAAGQGEMHFFDAVVGGNEIGDPLLTNGDCLGPEPSKQTVYFLGLVRRIEATATGGSAWIDDLRTNPPNPCATDTNGDGTTDVNDLVNVIVTWGTPGGTADVDASGVVNVDDLVAIITGWGDCA